MVFPSLLLAAGVVFTIAWLCIAMQHATSRAGGVGGLAIGGTSRVVFALVLLALTYDFATVRAASVINEYRHEVWLAGIRDRARRVILQRHDATGENRFRLSSCPPQLDNPWGSTGYFKWKGRPDVQVVLEGDEDTLRALGKEKWTTISCDVPPVFPWTLSDAVSDRPLSPVRNLMRVNDAGQGAYDLDYWVPQSKSLCDVDGQFNPNVGGSSSYQDSFRQVINFANVWTGRVERTLQVTPIAKPVWPSGKIAVSYVYRGQRVPTVPLEAFDGKPEERPLLRVSIENIGAGWISGYVGLHLACR
jgi:hypothetical protein